MPNWCQNEVTFYGTTEMVERVRKAVTGYIASRNENLQKELEWNNANPGATWQDWDKYRNENLSYPTGLFHTFLPRPIEEEENWYDWNVEHWGTKWDANDPLIAEYFEHGKGTPPNQSFITLTFETAWSPPLPFIQHMVDHYGYGVSGSYAEMGMGYGGSYEVECGKKWEDGVHEDFPEITEKDLLTNEKLQGFENYA